MKTSRYNVIYTQESGYILYNTYTCQSLFLNSELAKLLSDYDTFIDDLSSIHPDFFQALVAGGFVIQNDVDEIEAVEQLRLNSLADPTQYHLTINPTLDCNFHCWYCYESKVKGSEMSPSIIQSTISLIDKVLHDNPQLKRFHLYFFGGEPLLKFNEVVKPILKAFSEKTKERDIFRTVQITTNGALLDDAMLSYLKDCGIFTAFQITFDGYGDNHNKSRFSKIHPKSYHILIDNVKKLLREEMFVTVRVNYTHKNVDDLMKILNEFKECSEEERKRIIYTPVRIWQDSTRAVTKSACKNISMNETDCIITAKCNETLQYAVSLGMNVMPINSIDSVRNPCKHSFVNAASINYNGDVYKCCARAFNDDNREGVLKTDGSIEWKADLNSRILRKRTDFNHACKECFLFPVCGGGCVQSFKDFNEEYCLYRFDENSKLEAVKRLVSLTRM